MNKYKIQNYKPQTLDLMSNIAIMNSNVTNGASVNEFYATNEEYNPDPILQNSRLKKYQSDLYGIEREISNMTNELATEDQRRNQKQWEDKINKQARIQEQHDDYDHSNSYFDKKNFTPRYKPYTFKDYKTNHLMQDKVNTRVRGLGNNIGTPQWSSANQLNNKKVEFSEQVKVQNKIHAKPRQDSPGSSSIHSNMYPPNQYPNYKQPNYQHTDGYFSPQIQPKGLVGHNRSNNSNRSSNDPYQVNQNNRNSASHLSNVGNMIVSDQLTKQTSNNTSSTQLRKKQQKQKIVDNMNNEFKEFEDIHNEYWNEFHANNNGF